MRAMEKGKNLCDIMQNGSSVLQKIDEEEDNINILNPFEKFCVPTKLTSSMHYQVRPQIKVKKYISKSFIHGHDRPRDMADQVREGIKRRQSVTYENRLGTLELEYPESEEKLSDYDGEELEDMFDEVDGEEFK